MLNCFREIPNVYGGSFLSAPCVHLSCKCTSVVKYYTQARYKALAMCYNFFTDLHMHI